MVCSRAALPASSRRRLKAEGRVKAKAGHLEPDLAVRVEVDLAVRAEHLEAHLPLRAVLAVVRAPVKVALPELLEQDRAEHPVVDAPTRSPIPRMARFPTRWLAVRNQTT